VLAWAAVLVLASVRELARELAINPNTIARAYRQLQDDEVLVSAVRGAIERSTAALRQESELRTLRETYASLTPRERDVMGLVVRGFLNKQIAFELSISEITVKAHRGQVMRKMRTRSVADLVNIAARLGLEGAHGR